MEKKKEKNRYSLWDWPLLIDHLQNMAAEGWMLCDFHDKVLEFEKCPPQKVHFAVSFYPEYDFTSNVPEKLEEMWELCSMNGWQHITGNYSTQVFYNKEENPVPFHTDATVQLQNFDSMVAVRYTKRWKKTLFILPLLLVFVFALLVGSLLTILLDKKNFIWFYLVGSVAIFAVPYFIFEAVYLFLRLKKYKKWYTEAEKNAMDTNTVSHPIGQTFVDKVNGIITAAAVFFIAVETFAVLSLARMLWLIY
ncbi:MAG: DUF2812 domain-containing protein [Oscillospiraceae bacterium]|nr:DUF2812 domain-containing protein [Oscillospiraceae bacterium]